MLKSKSKHNTLFYFRSGFIFLDVEFIFNVRGTFITNEEINDILNEFVMNLRNFSVPDGLDEIDINPSITFLGSISDQFKF
jgi:hypothetical protein